MISVWKLVLSAVFFILGFGYLYRPDLIARLNSFLRDYLLNDSHIALERKKWGVFFLLIGFLLLYMGLNGMGRR